MLDLLACDERHSSRRRTGRALLIFCALMCSAHGFVPWHDRSHWRRWEATVLDASETRTRNITDDGPPLPIDSEVSIKKDEVTSVEIMGDSSSYVSNGMPRNGYTITSLHGRPYYANLATAPRNGRHSTNGERSPEPYIEEDATGRQASASLPEEPLLEPTLSPLHQNNEPSLRTMWKQRHARTIEEGIRREKTSKLLAKAAAMEAEDTSDKRYGARTITGLINALAEEVDDLDVQVNARKGTPFWSKQVDAVRINFTRLQFKPLRMGGRADGGVEDDSKESSLDDLELSCPDETFDRIDADNSGALDSDEIAQALNLATVTPGSEGPKSAEVIRKLATDLVKLYDFNGDGVVDRNEYRSLVRDMAALRISETQKSVSSSVDGWFSAAKSFAVDAWARVGLRDDPSQEMRTNGKDEEATEVEAESKAVEAVTSDSGSEDIVDISDDKVLNKIAKHIGSVTISDLKLDLRRLIFGTIPIIKHITPGGPLVLEPFTVTIDGSFNRQDIMESNLLDAGLRQLVARALRRRVGSVRDLLEGALFRGRAFKLISGTGPVVEVPKLTNVEFDNQNRLIITGRAKVQSRPDGPVIENAFKVRTKIGTRKDGRTIRLVEPELALVLECPQTFEENVAIICEAFDLPKPERPKPIYSFFPIYSPFKVDDNDGFDLGEDNCINSIYVEDGALCFQLSAVLRPGRFLGSHYIAFTVPIRTFIVTLDRVREGIRAARTAKKAAKKRKDAALSQTRTRIEQAIDAELYRTGDRGQNSKRTPVKSFFSRFVDGYLSAERDFSERKRMSDAIRDFFGRQNGNETGNK